MTLYLKSDYSSFLCIFDILLIVIFSCSLWPCGLRRGSASARLSGLPVVIPPQLGCLSLMSVVCCQVEVFVSV